jgi:hypothetical protein
MIVLTSRMRGAIPPLPNTPSWRGAQFKHRDNFTLLLLYSVWHIFIFVLGFLIKAKENITAKTYLGTEVMIHAFLISALH